MSKKEKRFFIILFAAYTLGFFFFPYFPLSRFTQFADAPRTYNDFLITSSKGSTYPAWAYGLGINYDGDPAMSQGRLYHTGNPWGGEPTKESLTHHLNVLQTWNWITAEEVCLEKRKWGTGPDGKFTQLESTKWLWKNRELSTCAE